ncbi:MAG: acetylornithine deacetylase [Pseudomonadales bacterium]
MNSKLPDFKDNLSQLIASASVSSVNPAHDMSNAGMINLLGGWLDSLGFRTEVQSVGENGKHNLIATIGSGAGGLVLSGHSDTVPYDDIQWLSDPFKCTHKQNGFYGLGSTDMKGFFAVALEAIQQTDLTALKAPLTLVATADEESTMSGARFLAKSGLSQGEAVIIGEPTDLKPVHMHKGISMQAIRITGRSGHSSNPELGNSALEAMIEVLGELQNFRARLQSQYRNEGFAIAVPTMNLGCIHGGDNPNRICGACELQFDLRPLPGMAIDDLRSDITALLEPIASRRGVTIDQKILFGGVEAFEEAADSDLVKNAARFSNAESMSVAFATEAPFYKSLGKQTIILGPGSIDQAHQPNEFLPDNQIEPGIRIYRQFIEHYCL